MLQHYYNFSQVLTFSGVLWYDNSNIRAPACYQYLLKPEYIDGLFPVYHALYPEIRNIDIGDLHFTIKKFSSICILSEKFGSKGESRNLRSARVLASWHTGDGSISPTSPLAPGVVDYYICHRLTLNGVEREHYFACTRLVKKHPNKHNLGCLNTLPVWDATLRRYAQLPFCLFILFTAFLPGQHSLLTLWSSWYFAPFHAVPIYH